jgi:adenosylcobinamide-phosphate synthase
MAEPVALLALAIDAAIGWPPAVYARMGHPVGLFAWIIRKSEHGFNRATWPDGVRRVAGCATMLLLIVLTGGIAFALQHGLVIAFGKWAWPFIALSAAPALAQRSLNDHVASVMTALQRGDFAAARRSVAMIVGRDTAGLDEAGISRAAIESLSESFCDGVVAPLFWLLLLGLPGVWIYKAINTADSLIGHREARWRAFGWAAARIDDVANFVPARLSGLLICIAGAGGFDILRRDAAKHASPNAGWPEAAMAGALGLRLAGPIAYDGVTQIKPWIGGGRADVKAADIARALIVYRRACLLLWIISGVVAWAL